MSDQVILVEIPTVNVVGITSVGSPGLIELTSTGPQGPAGPGLIAGGSTGQVLAKNSNTNYDTKWATLSTVATTGIYSDIIGTPTLSVYEVSANKNIADGYAGLDGTGKIAAAQLPSYVDDVLEYSSLESFPSTGETGKIYVDTTTNKTYRWAGSVYIEISPSPGSTDSVTEGTTNLYFSNTRARTAISATGSLNYNNTTGIISYTAPTSVSSFTNDSGYLTSGTLLSGLGYTPANKAGDTFTGPIILSIGSRSQAAWTTTGIGLVQSTTTFTDTTSTGTVPTAYMNLFAPQTYAATNTGVTITNLYGTWFNDPIAGTNVTAGARYALGTDSMWVNGTLRVQGSASLGASGGTGNISLGAINSTGAINIGSATGSQTTNIQAGATASASTKTINIGTAGLSGSTTAITIGSNVSGATQTTTVNGRVTFAPIGSSVPAWTTSGVGFVQSAATFTDTTSAGSVAAIYMNLFDTQTIASTSAITAITILYGAYFKTPARGANVAGSGANIALGTDSFNCVSTFTANVGSSTCSIGNGQTSGPITVGAATSTGAINLGISTVSQTISMATGATASGSTKTVNIGTNGVSGSTTNIAIGSSISGAISTTTLNGNTVATGTVQLVGYTVATLPAAGTPGRTAYVTDATAPTWLGTLTGGGTVKCPVFDNGTAWVAG